MSHKTIWLALAILCACMPATGAEKELCELEVRVFALGGEEFPPEDVQYRLEDVRSESELEVTFQDGKAEAPCKTYELSVESNGFARFRRQVKLSEGRTLVLATLKLGDITPMPPGILTGEVHVAGLAVKRMWIRLIPLSGSGIDTEAVEFEVSPDGQFTSPRVQWGHYIAVVFAEYVIPDRKPEESKTEEPIKPRAPIWERIFGPLPPPVKEPERIGFDAIHIQRIYVNSHETNHVTFTIEAPQ